MPTQFLGTIKRRTWMDDFLSGMQPGLMLAQQMSTERQRAEERKTKEYERKKQIADAIIAALFNTTEEYRQRMRSDPGWANSLRIVNEVYPGIVVGGDIAMPAEKPKTLDQRKSETYGTLPLEEQQDIVTGKEEAPFEPKKESYAFAFKQVQDAIATRRQPNPTWLKVIEAYIKPEAGTQLTGKDKVVQETWELIKEDLYAGRPVEPWQWEIVGGYVAAEKEGRLDPMEQAYQDVYGKYQQQGIEGLDEIEKNILKYHPTEPGPKDAIIKQIWAKYEEQGEGSLTDVEKSILAGIKPKEEQRIPPKEAAFETVWQKYLGGEVLTDIDRGIIGAELEKKTTPLSPKETAFQESWSKYTRLGGEGLTDIDKAQLGITPKAEKELTPQERAYEKAYERLKGNLRLTEFDRAILGIPLKKPEEIKGKELILDVISRKYLANETLTPEEWSLLGVTPKGEPTAQQQVVEYAFDRVKKARAAGQDPNPSDLKIVGGYVSAAPDESITAKIKAWAFDEMLAGRDTPQVWKILGGYVEPAAPSEEENIKEAEKLANARMGKVYGSATWFIVSDPNELKKRNDAFDRYVINQLVSTFGWSPEKARQRILRLPTSQTKYQPGTQTKNLSWDIVSYFYKEAPSDEVRRLQQRLKSLGYYKGIIDGKMGSFTEKALRQAISERPDLFQKGG